MKLPDKIQNVLDKTKALQAEIKAVGADSFKEIFTDFFKANPDVTGLRWTQYTPHFNDGDPCVFRVNDVTVRVREGVEVYDGKSKSWVSERLESDGEAFYDSYDFTSDHPIREATDDLYTVMQEIEDVMLMVFGDGVQVTATPDGEIEIDDYDHD